MAGASEGLGAAFSERLAARGMNLLLIARREAPLQETAEKLTKVYGVDVRCLAQDLAAPNLGEVFREATADLDVGMLVYNAAFVPMGPFFDTSDADIRQMMQVNMFGLVEAVRTVVPGMVARGRGGVILVSSLAGLQGFPGLAGYSATKAFIINLGEALWYELKETGVDAMAFIAGAMPTPGYNKLFEQLAPGGMSAERAAEQALSSLGKGPRCIPGFVNNLVAATTLRLLPRKHLIPLLARASQNMHS